MIIIIKVILYSTQKVDSTRAIILSNDGIISKEHIFIEEEQNKNESDQTLKELEKQILLRRLKEFQGNKTLTAKSLGVSVRWVQKKIKEIES